MPCLIYTYTDWQAQLVEPLRAKLAEQGETLFWIGRRSKPFAAPGIRGQHKFGGLQSFGAFETSGVLPLLDDPIAFEQTHLTNYLYQMARYSKGYAGNAHDLNRFHEYRDHFHLTARKYKRLLLREGTTSLLFVNMPHTGDDYLLYRVAEDMGLKVTILFTTLFERQLFSTPSLEAFGRPNASNPAPVMQATGIDILDDQIKRSVTSYMSGTYRDESAKPGEDLFAITALLSRMPFSRPIAGVQLLKQSVCNAG